MKTIKLPIQNHIDIHELQRVYSSAVRFAYNRCLEDNTEKEIRALMKEKFLIGSWFVQCSIKQAQAIWESQKELKIPKIIFGTKDNFKKRQQNKITKQEYNEARLLNITSQGEKLQNGNRFYTLDVIDNNQIIFKPQKGIKHIIQLPKLRKNIKKELQQLQVFAQRKEIAIQISLNKTHIYFSFDESLLYKNQLQRIETRVLGIDLNPNYIGFSVLQFDTNNEFKIIHKEVVDLKELNKQKSNKKDFEFFQITKHVIEIANKFNVNKIVLEELIIKAKDHKIGKKFNKLVNNDWNRNIITSSLKKHCNVHKIQYIEVNAAYSSTVGNLLYANTSTPDMVASSIEIARRAYKKYEKLWFYPSTNALLETGNQWKEELYSRFSSWVKIHNEIKNSKLKYRVQLEECIPDAVFRMSSIRSCVTLYNFI